MSEYRNSNQGGGDVRSNRDGYNERNGDYRREQRGERSERAEDSAAPPSVPAPVSPDGYAALARKERAEKAGTASDRPVAAVGANKETES